MDEWRKNLIDPDDEAAMEKLIAGVQRVAVLGVKTEAQENQPAFYVYDFLLSHGVDAIPVPVYYPEVTEIRGRKVYRKVSDVPGDLDVVDVFRKPDDIPAHLPDILAKHPKVVWFQLGIRHDAAAEQLARAGIQVVQDRCLKVEWRKYRS